MKNILMFITLCLLLVVSFEAGAWTKNECMVLMIKYWNGDKGAHVPWGDCYPYTQWARIEFDRQRKAKSGCKRPFLDDKDIRTIHGK